MFPLSLLFLFLFLLIGSVAFFSLAEIGMLSINRYKLKHLVKQKNAKALSVYKILSHPERFLNVVLIGNTLANIFASMLATLIGQRLHGNTGVAIAEGILTFVILVFAEMMPKTIAILYPLHVSFIIIWPLRILQWVMAPIVWISSLFSNAFLRLFNIQPGGQPKEHLTGEELRSVVHEAGGLLPMEHKSMLLSLLDLEQASVEDIMIPKAELIGLDVDKPWTDILEQLETAQHTRLPIYRQTIDHLVGIIHVRDVLNLALEDNLDLEHLIESARSPYYVPEATPLNIQLLNFRKTKHRSAFVVDEYGGLQGLITMEDILEEIVGEFTTDIADFTRSITTLEDGSVIVDASQTIRYLNRVMAWDFPLLGPKTLSGLIIEYLGYIPPADSCLKLDKFRIEILKISDNTIKRVKLLP